MRRWIVVTAGAMFGVTLVATCGSNPDMQAMLDMAGLPTADIATADAQTAPTIEVACDKERVFTSTTVNTTATTTDWFADGVISGLDPTAAPNISVVLCDMELFGTARHSLAPPGCAASATCETTGYDAPIAAVGCERASQFWFGNGRLIVRCGQRLQSTTLSSSTDSGWRAQKVYVRVL